MAETAVVEPDSERLQAVQNRIRLLEVQERIKQLEASPGGATPPGGPLPPAPAPSTPGATGTWTADTPAADPDAELIKSVMDRESALLQAKGFDPVGAAGLAINMALPGLGGMAGQALKPVVGRLAPIAGELIASYGARAINKAIGAEQPGIAGDVASVAVPALVRGAQALKNPVLQRLPGASAVAHAEGADDLARMVPEPPGGAVQAAQAQLEAKAPGVIARTGAQQELESLRPPAGQAAAQIDTLLTQMQPATPSTQLYAPLHTDTTPIRPSNIWKTATEVLKREKALQPTFRDSRVAQVAQDLRELVKVNQGAIPLNTLVEHQQRLGLLIRQASAENWPQERALKQLYKGFIEDTEHAATQGVPGAIQFREAAKTARREFALEDVRTMLQPGSPGVVTTPQGAAQLPGGTQLERSLNKKYLQDELFRGSFTPAEWSQIQQRVKTAQSHEAVSTFLDRLQAGKPGMVTDPATGTTRIGNVTPVRTAFEQEYIDNPAFTAAVTGRQVQQLRELFTGAEREQTLTSLTRHLRPGQPGVSTDPATGAIRIDTVRPVRMAFDKELANNPTLGDALGPQAVQQLRDGLRAAEKEQMEDALAKMFRVGGPGINTRGVDGLVQLDGGKMRRTFEAKLGNDKDFAAMMDPQLRDELRQTFTALEKLPKIPPPRGQTYGSGGVLSRSLSVGAVVGAVTGSSVAGTLAGQLAGGAPQYIAQALMTPGGRRWLTAQLAKDGGITPAALGLISGGGRVAVEQGTTVQHQRVP